MIYLKKFTLLQNSVYPLSFDTSYKMYLPCMAKHEPFQMMMLTRNGFGRWRDAREYGGLRARGVLPRQRHTKIEEFMLAITAATTPK